MGAGGARGASTTPALRRERETKREAGSRGLNQAKGATGERGRIRSTRARIGKTVAEKERKNFISCTLCECERRERGGHGRRGLFVSARAYIRISVRRTHERTYTRGGLHAYTRILTKRITGKYQRPTVESVIMYVCMYVWCVCVRARELDDTPREGGEEASSRTESAPSFPEPNEPRSECPLSRGEHRERERQLSTLIVPLGMPSGLTPS